MAEVKIRIESLYKIFGSRARSVLEDVRHGMSKQELLERHNHVLGLKDINVDVAPREVSVIMGLSGSGKSTLIRHVNRLIEPTAGRIVVDGTDVLEMTREELIEFRRHKVSMVFQRFGLHVHKTVAENAAYGLVIQGTPVREAKQRSRKWLERVGLAGFENHYPSQLSGGMQQRVGLARRPCHRRRDPADGRAVLGARSAHSHRHAGRAPGTAGRAAQDDRVHHPRSRRGAPPRDSIAILRDGAIIQQGNPQDIILHPADDYIFDFIKDINRSRVIETKSVMTPGEAVDGPRVAHDLVLEEALQIVSATQDHRANVVDADGAVIGSIDLNQIIDGIARPVESNDQGETYR